MRSIGGIATFASWQLQSFRVFSNFEGVDQSWVKNATNGLSQVFATLCTTFFSLHFGRHIGSHFPDFRSRITRIQPRTASALSFLALLSWLAALLILCLTSETSFRSGRRIAFALTLAPPATWIRWWLGYNLNPRSPPYVRFGTLTANILSTSLAATCFLLQNLTPLNTQLSLFQCQTLQAVQDGFCGGLSTIPAILEQADIMHGKFEKRWWLAWIYIVGWQYGLNQLIVILIVGVGWWVKGKGEMCSS